MRETDPPTAMVMEDEGEGMMKAGNTEISPPTTVKLVSYTQTLCILRLERMCTFQSC